MSLLTSLRTTPLHALHQASGAKLVPFAGWEMPLQFSKVLEEHHAVRKAAGLFDISHMALLTISAQDPSVVQAALNYLVPQDLTKLYPGKAVYTQLLNETGGMLDDIIVYALPRFESFSHLKDFLVICNASNQEKVMHWLKSHLPESCSLNYLNASYSLLALQGPQFQQVLNKAGLTPTELPKRFHLQAATLLGFPVILSRTGYTGEDGVEIIVDNQHAPALWQGLLEKGQDNGLLPVGLAARDTLRLEAAYPLYGHELNENLTPLEAGLAWSVKLNKPDAFIGQSALQLQQENGLTQHFICFELNERAIPRQGDTLYTVSGEVYGEVTSGSISPTLNRPIGVGYIKATTPPEPGTSILIGIRANQVPAKVVKRPFYP